MTKETSTINILSVGHTQEEIRALKDLRDAFERIPAHRRMEACRELIRQFPETRISINGVELKP